MTSLKMNPQELSKLSAAAFLVLSILNPARTIAAPLDKDTCAKLAQDIQGMKALDVDRLMERGPNWAVSHLSQDDLSLVRRYIDTDEQMKFRCSAPSSLVHLKNVEDDDEEASKPEAKSPDGAAGKAAGAGEADGGAAAPATQKTPKAQKKVKPPLHANSSDNR